MVILASSPVWYQTRGCDTSPYGQFAFASRTLLYIINLKESPVTVSGTLNAHKEKVLSCSFNSDRKATTCQLVSSSDDGVVILWDVERKEKFKEHAEHRGNAVVCVHWNPVNHNLIYSADDKGFVISWNVSKDTYNRFQPDGTSQMQLTIVTCSPHDENLVAIGYKSGAVSIMNTSKHGEVIRKFRGHQSDIHSLIWCPHKNENIVNSESSVDSNSDDTEHFGLVLSGSKDATVRVWSVKSSKCVKRHRLPQSHSKGRRAQDDGPRLFTAVYWPKDWPNNFISSSFNGELIKWDMEGALCNISTNCHQRIVFNICPSMSSNSFITTSMDRTIMQWTMPDGAGQCKTADWSMPTLGGFVYVIAVCPMDESVVAIGVGDGTIRIWHTMNPRNIYDMTTLWQGVKEKVMALSWHPLKQGILAFGTEDGKVGIYDILSMKQPLISETYHMKPVYSLSWGPTCAVKTISDKLCIYSCGGDSNVLMHKPHAMNKDAVNIRNIILETNGNSKYQPGRHSDVEWKQDLSLLAIGNEDGVVNIYRAPNLQHIVRIKAHSKIVNCIRWKPSADGKDSLIASGSNAKSVNIHNISDALLEKSSNGSGDNDNNVPTVVEITEPFRSMNGHLSRITGLAWSPDHKQIASSSYDGSVQVWDVNTESPLFNFQGHTGRVMCVTWSSASQRDYNNGVLFSGADDYSVHRWFMEDQKFTGPPTTSVAQQMYSQKKNNANKKNNPKKKQKPSAAVVESLQVNGTISTKTRQNDEPDLFQLLENKKAELVFAKGQQKTIIITKSQLSELELPSTSDKGTQYSNPEAESENNTSSNKGSSLAPNFNNIPSQAETSVKRKKFKSLFPTSVSLDNSQRMYQQQDVLDIFQWREFTKKKRDDEVMNELGFLAGDAKKSHLGFYTDRRAAHRMLRHEYNHMKQEETEGMYLAKVWTGDIVGALTDAEQNGQLTDQLLSLAPSCGYRFWKKMSRSYAEQLKKSGHPFEASQHLIASGQIYAAIKLLSEHKMYREAVALARAKLDDSDPVLIETIKMWANKLKTGGSVEMAAKCFCSLGDYNEAAICLSMRTSTVNGVTAVKDVGSMWTASTLALMADNTKLSHDLIRLALSKCCLQFGNWETNQESMKRYRNLKSYRLFLVIHELLVSQMFVSMDIKLLEKTFLKVKKSDWNDFPYFKSIDVMFSKPLHKIWIDEEMILKAEDDTEVLEKALQELQEFSNNQQSITNLTPKQVLYQVSVKVTICEVMKLINKTKHIHNIEAKLSHLQNYCTKLCEDNEIYNVYLVGILRKIFYADVELSETKTSDNEEEVKEEVKKK